MSSSQVPCLITLVEQQKGRKNRYNIYLNDEFSFSVHEDILIKHHLFKNEEINKELMMKIIQDEENHRALLIAIRFLSRRPRSQMEIERKLIEKGYEQNVIDLVLLKLKKDKYVDDQAFANLFTKDRIYTQKKGHKWVEQELLQKGLPKEYIANALKEIDETTEMSQAFELGKKQFDRQTGDKVTKKRKVGSFLLRRGYSYSLVKQVLAKLEGNDDNQLTFDE